MSRKLTTEEFIERARKVHGDRYGYSKTAYCGAKHKLIVTCKVHGDFQVLPYNHLHGDCKQCVRPSLDTETFIVRAKAKHGHKYDYTETVYAGNKLKVAIRCPEHGVFTQRPDQHLAGNGCPICAHQLIGKKASRRFKQEFTRDRFLQDAKKAHGEKYDYSEVDFKNQNTPVTIICPEHGPSRQTPYQHLKGHGCRRCGIEASAAGRKTNLEQFVAAARAVHGDKFDYSQADYQGSGQPVTVICPEHGPWAVTPSNHVGNGSGCPKCYGRNRTTEDYIAEARKAHGDRYDYSQTVYIDARTKVTIICPEHGPFTQKAVSHTTGKGCKKCGDEESGDKRRLSTEQFIADAKAVHGDKYDYSQTVYNGKPNKLTIICRKHGPFRQSATGHKSGNGCPICKAEAFGDRFRDTAEGFIAKARAVHGDKYDYSHVKYHNNRTRVKIICPEHGPFEQAPDRHVYQGSGCSRCAKTGFSTQEPGILYYIRIDTRNQTVYKIGITNHSVRRRFRGSDRDKITILHREYFDNGIEALERETELLRDHREYRYQGEPVIRGAGTAEMFDRDVLGMDDGTGGIPAAQSKRFKPPKTETRQNRLK